MAGWDLFQDTTFGHLVRFISGGKIFGWAEQKDSSVLERYLHSHRKLYRSGSDSDYPPTTSATRDGEKGNDTDSDAEKGKDFHLVDWIENDPQVGTYVNNQALHADTIHSSRETGPWGKNSLSPSKSVF